VTPPNRASFALCPTLQSHHPSGSPSERWSPQRKPRLGLAGFEPTTDEKFCPLVVEFVTRANHRIVIGHFDYDIDEGKLRYHVGHPFGERGLDEDMVGRLFATAMGTADRYFPALMRTLVGGETPADAIYLAELDYHAEAVEQEVDERPQTPPSAAPKAPPKRKARRLRPPRSWQAYMRETRWGQGGEDHQTGERRRPWKNFHTSIVGGNGDRAS